MPSLPTRRVLTSTVLALGASLLIATPVLAAPDGPPQSGDDRAKAVAGNATTCEAAGLGGTKVVFANVEDATQKFVTITAADVPSGDTLLGVVVKGGPAYNVYTGLTEWTKLHSPINPGGQLPTI
ncbi:MAG TPA: hypothetical protein VJX10_19610, partial [Pseudonocardiaceae bacterium]|nr:hypothetical protein [Pseudonocardiaceae bacterium]